MSGHESWRELQQKDERKKLGYDEEEQVPRRGSGGRTADLWMEGVGVPEDFKDRRGYDVAFLPTAIPLPSFSDGGAPDLLLLGDVPGSESPWLHYEHFSLAMSMKRRLARVTAVNIDAKLRPSEETPRPTDWWDDPRIDGQHQIGRAAERGFYGDTPFNFDRGHLVRREDPIWGKTLAEAQRANADTHHFTNCTPQHQGFNQDSLGWRAVEEHIQRQVLKSHARVSVFTGPVLQDDDPLYAAIRVPVDYWKIIVTSEQPDNPVSVAFSFSQRELLTARYLEAAEVDWLERIRARQVTVSSIETKCGLQFGSLSEHDPLAGRSIGVAESPEVPLITIDDIVLEV